MTEDWVQRVNPENQEGGKISFDDFLRGLKDGDDSVFSVTKNIENSYINTIKIFANLKNKGQEITTGNSNIEEIIFKVFDHYELYNDVYPDVRDDISLFFEKKYLHLIKFFILIGLSKNYRLELE